MDQENNQEENVVQEEVRTCNLCQLNYGSTVAFCTNCGYPFEADDRTQARFIAEKIQTKSNNKDTLHKSANALFGAAVLYLVSGLIGSQGDTFVMIVAAIIAAVFVGLGIWARQNPLPAIISGIALFTILIIVAAIGDPISIFSGILWKVLIFGFLIRGFVTARELHAQNKLAQDA